MTRSPTLFLTPLSVLALFSVLLGCGGTQTESSQQDSRIPVVAVVGEGAPAVAVPEVVGSVDSETAMTEAPQPEVVAQPASLPFETTASLALDAGTSDIVRLAQAQVGDEVMLAHVENSSVPFRVGVDEILYLHDLGVSASVISAMIRRNETLSGDNGAVAPVIDRGDVTPQTPVGLAHQDDSSVSEVPVSLAAANASPAVSGSEPVTRVTNNYFYDSLSPYGQWMDVPDYGLCWRPSVAVVNRDWQPYYHGGRWIYSDAGWYWHSYYTWGWAPFHYGRWHRSPASGWVWVPGTTWGPAWVTWRWSSGYCGWAPLPPRSTYRTGVGLYYGGSRVSVSFGFGLASDCYAFVPSAYFYSPKPWLYCPPRRTVNQVYQNSTVINNYVQGNNNNVVVNVGPGKATIEHATRSEIRSVALRDAPVTEGRVIQPTVFNPQGKSLEVFRPAVASVPTVDSIPKTSLTRGERRSPSTLPAEGHAASALSGRSGVPSNPGSGDQGVVGSMGDPSNAALRSTRSETRRVLAASDASASVSKVEPRQSSSDSTGSPQLLGSSSRRLTAPSRATASTGRVSAAPASRTETRSSVVAPSIPQSRSQYSVVPRTSRSDFSVSPSRTTSAPVSGRSETRSVSPPTTPQVPRSLAPQPPSALNPNPRNYAPSSAPSQSYAPRSIGVPQSPSRAVSPMRSAPAYRPSTPSPSPGRMSVPASPSRSTPSRPASPSRSGRSG